MSHLLHNRALHDGAVKVGFGSLLLICIGAPSGGDTSTPAPTISLLLPFIRRSHIMVQRHLAAEHWVVKRLSVAMQALKIRFRLFRPFSHSRDTFETPLQMVWHPSSLLKFHVFSSLFVFLLYFVINMVGEVGVGSVVMSVAVCGRFSPGSHTP